MGPLVAIGGVHVAAAAVGPLEREIDALCARVGFPYGEQFKWSPGKQESFMKRELIEEARVHFYEQLIPLARDHGARAFVVMEDTDRRRAISTSTSPEHDVTTMFLERADWCFGSANQDGVVVIATPSGGQTGETRFLAECVATIEGGTAYTDFKRMPLGVMFARSRYLRLLQLADVVTSCAVARFAGETKHAPAVFELVKTLLRKDGGRVGGVGVKLHPDFRYCNLYHWLLGDSVLVKGFNGWPLPIPDRPYARSPDVLEVKGI